MAGDFRRIPDCQVLVAGNKLAIGLDSALTRVEVDLDVDLFGECVLTFHDPLLAPTTRRSASAKLFDP